MMPHVTLPPCSEVEKYSQVSSRLHLDDESSLSLSQQHHLQSKEMSRRENCRIKKWISVSKFKSHFYAHFVLVTRDFKWRRKEGKKERERHVIYIFSPLTRVTKFFSMSHSQWKKTKIAPSQQQKRDNQKLCGLMVQYFTLSPSFTWSSVSRG